MTSIKTNRIFAVRVTLVAVAVAIALLPAGGAQAIVAKDKKAVNYDTMFYDATDATVCGTASPTSGPLVGGDNVEKAWNFFISKGLTPNQTAGIIGNLMQESGVNPLSDQKNGPGRGIAQWSEGERWDGPSNSLKSWAIGRDILQLATQLDFMYYEMTEAPVYGGTYAAMKATTTIEEAVLTFEKVYERAGNPVLGARLAYAREALETYGANATPTNPTANPTEGFCSSANDGTVSGDAKPGEDTSALTCAAGTDAGIGTVHEGQSGQTYQIRLCNVQGITINASLSGQLDALLTASKGSGRKYTGYGYRTYERQQELRRSNGCPDVFNAPSSACRVPTARPGFSNHEGGLAIDFSDNGVLIRSKTTAGFTWLAQNASKYGLKNFPKEAWHWSVDGT